MSSWATVTLSDCIYEDREPVRTFDGDGLPVYGVTNVEGVAITGVAPSDDRSKYLRLRPNRFIYNPYRVNVGSLGLSSTDQNGISSPAYVIFGCREDLEPKFLLYYLRSHHGHILINFHGNRGTVRAALRFNDLCQIEIPLPPVAEQRRIVARIEELAAKIEEARGLRRQAAIEAEGLVSTTISTLFSEGIEKGWLAGLLGDYVIDDCYGTSEKADDDESGTPILRMGNIQNGRLVLRDLKYLHLNEKDRTKLLLTPGDILVNRTNSAELVGKCSVFDLDGEYAFASYLIRLRLDATRAEPKLVASYINSPPGRAYMFSERKQMTGQANVNATKLKALPIALPPLAEQRSIIAYLDDLQDKVDALKGLQATTAAELNAMLPSILDKAFKGEL